ncbi:hypothetical protein Z517_02822 [Fonsecaea pedrosoi CBS 271.37]|uniref:Uncharacterized protein n=1 Tax=Fonsecaea pedrosoi CBS 271.37 TaxID=1442368 RepID=A0A0D2FAB7_9EURO|nr:uncharacterized protein Z517_02822 [Fonsecaea pedrosoi CBS 271.37]KIW83577.1 hypothetical protein Z517_02822 [Fonsecaea pedrosoi CBS 271.37]
MEPVRLNVKHRDQEEPVQNIGGDGDTQKDDWSHVCSRNTSIEPGDDHSTGGGGGGSSSDSFENSDRNMQIDHVTSSETDLVGVGLCLPRSPVDGGLEGSPQASLSFGTQSSNNSGGNGPGQPNIPEGQPERRPTGHDTRAPKRKAPTEPAGPSSKSPKRACHRK